MATRDDGFRGPLRPPVRTVNPTEVCLEAQYTREIAGDLVDRRAEKVGRTVDVQAAPATELMGKPDVYPTALDVRVAFDTETCVCGDKKERRRSFCWWCWAELSERMQSEVRGGDYSRALPWLARRFARRLGRA